MCLCYFQSAFQLRGAATNHDRRPRSDPDPSLSLLTETVFVSKKSKVPKTYCTYKVYVYCQLFIISCPLSADLYDYLQVLRRMDYIVRCQYRHVIIDISDVDFENF